MSSNSLSFRVGVTGHRDIPQADFESADNRSREFLSALRSSMPDTRITVLSGLADGADRIFAKAALALNISVEAVLPMPFAFYKSDFDATSLADLEEILNSELVECIELPLNAGLGDDESAWPQDSRSKLYSNLSNDLRDRSNILVAFWDGKHSSKAGGTADTVLKFLQASPSDNDSEIDIINADGANLDGQAVVYWMPSRRSASQDIVMRQTESVWLSAYGSKFRQWDDTPRDFALQLDEFNQFNQTHHTLDESNSLTSYGDLLEGCSDDVKQDKHQLTESNCAYVMADSLALYYQSQSDRLFKWFALMTATMGFLFLLYAKIAAVQFFLIGYLALFFIGLFLSSRGGKRQWFTRHLAYRCLAETIRVRFYLDLAGAREKSIIQSLLIATGINKFEGFSWIRDVLQTTNPVFSMPKLTGVSDKHRIDLVRKLWIDDQASYFQRKAHQLHEFHEKLEKIKFWIIWGLVIAAFSLVFFKKVLLGVELGEYLNLKTLVIFFMGLLPFWFGVWEMYQGKMAVKELMWQYRNQAENFAAAEQLLQNTDGIELQRKIVAQLGESCILENFVWIINRYHREQEPPTAG
jgi:hypothetical protein